MVKSSEKEKALTELTSKIFDAMLEEIVMDTVLASHQEMAKSRTICHICHTRCGLDHAPGTSSSASLAVPSTSRHPTPSAEGKGLNGSLNGTGTSTPTSVKTDSTIYFECQNCQRQIASNRYAPHLSSCMGIGTGTRRAANRSNAKAKISAEAGRSQSPYVASENGAPSDGESPSPTKAKGKSKAKRGDDADFNLKRKRPESPQVSPSPKKSKKQKTTGSPVSRVKADLDAVPGGNSYHLPGSNSQSKIPSRLRDSSMASFEPDASSSSRSTSPGTPMASTTSTSASLIQSPPRKKLGRPPKVIGKKAGPPPKKAPSPPRPPPPPVRAPEPDFIDVEGEETGSSTDTSESS